MNTKENPNGLFISIKIYIKRNVLGESEKHNKKGENK